MKKRKFAHVVAFALLVASGFVAGRSEAYLRDPGLIMGIPTLTSSGPTVACSVCVSSGRGPADELCEPYAIEGGKNCSMYCRSPDESDCYGCRQNGYCEAWLTGGSWLGGWGW
jgi:hypothetical protein